MIRPITKEDREEYLAMATCFYQSDAVASPVPRENLEKTFDLLICGTPFAQGFMLEQEGKPAGYALLARTWSQEAGGEVVWVEEIMILPEFRGQGLGKEFFAFLENAFPQARRFRLEVEEENEGAVRLYKSLGFTWLAYKQMKKER